MKKSEKLTLHHSNDIRRDFLAEEENVLYAISGDMSVTPSSTNATAPAGDPVGVL